MFLQKTLFMINIRFFILLVILNSIVAGCKKNSSINPYPVFPMETTTKTATEILTAKPWRLLSYGFDTNKNGLIDLDEEAIRDCEKDNSYKFNKDGSGTVAENVLVCSGNNPLNQFAWTLTNNDTELDFYYGKAYVQQLTTDKLFLANTNFDEIKLLLVYGH